MAKLSAMLELHCPGLFGDEDFATWLNAWVGLGLATWHTGGEPHDMSDVFVMFDHGEGDSAPDGEGGMPRHAWEFIGRKAKEYRLDCGVVRLVNCAGDPADDFPG